MPELFQGFTVQTHPMICNGAGIRDASTDYFCELKLGQTQMKLKLRGETI